MSDLTKNKAANALVWAAFFAFSFHSLHCCRTNADKAERRAFDALASTNDACNAFCRLHCFSTSTSKRDATQTPPFARPSDVPKPSSSNACPPSRLQTEKKFHVDFSAVSNRTSGGVSPNDARFASAVAFLNRFTAAFSTPLYLRLRKFLN